MIAGKWMRYRVALVQTCLTGLLAGVTALSAQAPSPLSESQREWLAQRGPIRMCVDPNWMPLEAIDDHGRHTGIGADLIAAMAQRGSLQIELVRTSTWPESERRARARECDILSLASETAERRAVFDFTTAYLSIPGVVVTDLDVPFIRNTDQLADQTIAMLRGVSSIAEVKLRHPGMRIIEVASYEEGFSLVQSRQAFGLLGNMASVSTALQRNHIRNLKIAGTVGFDSDLRVATRNDQPMLGEVFEVLVQDLDPQTVQQITNRWIPVRYEHGFDYTLMWKLLPWSLLALAAMLGWVIKLRRLNRELAAANARLRQVSRVDALTGLFNRVPLDEMLAAASDHCKVRGSPLGLAMVDIDHFKAINDQYGHAAGDAALRDIAAILMHCFGDPQSRVLRLGGEEFLIIRENIDSAEFGAQLELLRARIAGQPTRFQQHEIPLRVSIGWICIVPADEYSPEQALRRADAALYRAKGEGRNRILEA